MNFLFLFFISFLSLPTYSAYKKQVESDKEECRTIGTLGACNNYEEYIKAKRINDKLDDNKRKREAVLNDFDTLVDKKTGLSLRLLTFNYSLDREMKREKKKEDKNSDGFTNEVQIVENNIVHGFFLDSAIWGKSSKINVLYSTPEYIYFQSLAYSSLHVNAEASLQKKYYLYDRKYSALVGLFGFDGPYKEWKEPLLLFKNGKYQFNWKGRDVTTGDDITHVFYDFSIDFDKKTSKNTIACSHHWDEGCEIKLFSKEKEHRAFKVK